MPIPALSVSNVAFRKALVRSAIFSFVLIDYRFRVPAATSDGMKWYRTSICLVRL